MMLGLIYEGRLGKYLYLYNSRVILKDVAYTRSLAEPFVFILSKESLLYAIDLF